METQSKPRIRRSSGIGEWECEGGGVRGFGVSPAAAYARWKLVLSRMT
jgi:hypothetical protein